MLDKDDHDMEEECNQKLTSELKDHIESMFEDHELSFENLVEACEDFEDGKVQKKPKIKLTSKKEKVANGPPEPEVSDDELNGGKAQTQGRKAERKDHQR